MYWMEVYLLFLNVNVNVTSPTKDSKHILRYSFKSLNKHIEVLNFLHLVSFNIYFEFFITIKA